MDRSISIGSYAGIPVKIHWSFGLVILFILYLCFNEGLNLQQSLGLFLYVILLFSTVVLHEYGHALTAKKYGIITKDIILSPIGGLARMMSFPKAPKKEFYIALAGPLVNLLIALIIFAILFLTGINVLPEEHPFDLLTKWQGIIQMLFWMNVVLFTFNLIPAFPMDGGRILRALLSMKLNRVKSTNIASYIGQALAIGFFIFGILNNHIALIFIGIFIFFQAASERKQIYIQERLENTTAHQIVNTGFLKIYGDQILDEIFPVINQTHSKSFLVFNRENKIIGSLPSIFIKDAIQSKNLQLSIEQLTSPKILEVKSDTSLSELFDLMQSQGHSIAAIINDNQILGSIDRTDLMRYIKSGIKNTNS